MLPSAFRQWLFDRLSVRTMRYVTAVPRDGAAGLTRHVYDMIEEDFFINGSLTSRSQVPELMAAIWCLGRETMLVDDRLDRTTKEAVCGVMSNLNDCPYCGDMLVSLVHAGDEHDAAEKLFESRLGEIEDPVLRARLEWVEAVTSPGDRELPPLPYTVDELPELLGSMLGMADINRFSHVVMDGSPVDVGTLQGSALRLFGNELRATKRRAAEPGRALELLPAAALPDDLAWAAPNPRVADSIARWAAALRRETDGVIPAAARRAVAESLDRWRNEEMPPFGRFEDPDVAHLHGEEQAIARLAIVLAKAPYRVTEELVEPLLAGGEERFVRILAWAASVGARRFAALVAEHAARQLGAPRALATATSGA